MAHQGGDSIGSSNLSYTRYMPKHVGRYVRVGGRVTFYRATPLVAAGTQGTILRDCGLRIEVRLDDGRVFKTYKNYLWLHPMED